MKITTAEEMRTIDRVTSERFGVRSLALMESAGTAVANVALARWPKANRITVVCGKGNNGGDGFVAARRLHQAGKIVEVLLLGAPEDLKGDAAAMFANLPLKAVAIREESQLVGELERGLGHAELIVDAVLGTGFKPPVRGLAAAAIQAINKTSAPVLAVDLPSGADADLYTAQKDGVARADAIVTFTAARPAHVFGQLTRGPVWVAPIGSPDEAVVSALKLQVITPQDVAPLLAPRELDSNKGRFGHVLVIGGSLGKSGAAAMCGMAALRAGAGLTTVATPLTVLPTVAGFAPELMTEPLAETAEGTISAAARKAAEKLLQGRNVLAIGPGISRNAETSAFVRALAHGQQVPTVLDADGLNAFDGHATELRASGRTLVVTPHPGEMARLTGMSVAEVQRDRLGCARDHARRWNAIVVLKGYATVIALPDGNAWVNTTGNAGMATGGTGDILTGMIAGFMAQFPLHPALAVAAAVYLHGAAGDAARDELGEQAMIATDLLHYLPEAMYRTVELARQPMVRLA